MTLGTMIDRIDDDLKRNGSQNVQIQRAILSAIEHYKDERFWFLEGKQTASTVADQTTYAFDATQIEVDSFTITVSNNEYQLIPRTFDWYREVNTNPNTVTGIPTDYAVHQELYYLYPTPNEVYTLTWYGHQGQTTLSATTDTNGWMTDGERLIRYRACYYFISDTEQDPDRASMWGGESPDGTVMGLEGEALRALKHRNVQRISTGILQPEYF